MEILYGADHLGHATSQPQQTVAWMIDLLMLVLLAVAFLCAAGYVRVCERLTASPNHSDEASR
jgi:hypothetical protein